MSEAKQLYHSMLLADYADISCIVEAWRKLLPPRKQLTSPLFVNYDSVFPFRLLAKIDKVNALWVGSRANRRCRLDIVRRFYSSLVCLVLVGGQYRQRYGDFRMTVNEEFGKPIQGITPGALLLRYLDMLGTLFYVNQKKLTAAYVAYLEKRLP